MVVALVCFYYVCIIVGLYSLYNATTLTEIADGLFWCLLGLVLKPTPPLKD